jgi:hypothetical protein
MSDPVVPAQEAPVTTPVVGDDASVRLAILEKELKDARSEAAKYRTTLRAQEAAQSEAKKKQDEEQGNFKALYEQAQADAQKAAALVAQYEARSRQQQIASELGLPPQLADRLRGDTPAELKADAQTLLDLIKAQTPPAGVVQAPILSPTNPPSTRQATAAFDPKNPPRLSDVQWKK